MPRVHFVKKARKKNPVAKKGEPYYWWKPRVNGRGGSKRYSKTPPRPSQLTQSEFLSAVYSIQEDMDAASPEDFDDLVSLRDGWVDEIRQIGEDCQSKYDNMPDGLQQGETGQLLEERANAMEAWASDLENVDLGAPEKADEVADALADCLDDLRSFTPDV